MPSLGFPGPGLHRSGAHKGRLPLETRPPPTTQVAWDHRGWRGEPSSPLTPFASLHSTSAHSIKLAGPGEFPPPTHLVWWRLGLRHLLRGTGSTEWYTTGGRGGLGEATNPPRAKRPSRESRLVLLALGSPTPKEAGLRPAPGGKRSAHTHPISTHLPAPTPGFSHLHLSLRQGWRPWRGAERREGGDAAELSPPGPHARHAHRHSRAL